MTIEILEPHGFCTGVKAAIETALRALSSSSGKVNCLHELVHNEAVVADLRERGLGFVEDLAEVPDGAMVLVSAHGTTPAVRREAERRGLVVLDATCPFVARVHRQVRAYAERRLGVVVVGHAAHVEVRGVVGEARDAGAQVAVVKDSAEVEGLSFPSGCTVGVVCQTTLAAEAVKDVLAALRARYRIEVTPAAEICTATRDRQDSVRAFVGRGGDGVLVLGSAKSSNTRRLAETAEACGARAWRVATLDELSTCDFSGIGRLGVTSGASTPEVFLAAAVARLK